MSRLLAMSLLRLGVTLATVLCLVVWPDPAPKPWPQGMVLTRAEIARRPTPVAQTVNATEAPAPTEPLVLPKPPSPIRVPLETLQEWSSYDHDPELQTYHVGRVRLTISQADLDKPQHERDGLRVQVRAPGMKTRTLLWPDNAGSVRFGVGRIDPARPGPQVLLLRWTLGAHCCFVATLLTPDGDRWRVEDLDEWDDGNLFDTTFNPGVWPKDRDGDGAPEFIVPDERFRYVFEAYVASIAPISVQQVHRGQMVDVSDRRAFRPIFQKTLALQKERCDGTGSNGYCAAYVATASRLGQRRQAWAWMLKRRDSHLPWTDEDCRNLIDERALCPRIIAGGRDSFPLALGAFLRANGYPS